MVPSRDSQPTVSAGDLDGLGRIYTREALLIPIHGETVLREASGWDVNIISPWRRVLPGIIFEGYNGKAQSRLYITDQRIVLIREIDVWREVKGEYTLLGTPNAAAKQLELNEKKRLGARQFCVIRPRDLRAAKSKSYDRPRSLLYMRAVNRTGKQYAITIWKTDGMDPEILGALSAELLGH